MAGDLADGVAAVSGDAMAEALLPVADGDDALRIPVPGDIVDPTRDDAILACPPRAVTSA